MDINKFVDNHLIWIVTVLVAVGGFIFTIKSQAVQLENQETRISKLESITYRLDAIDKNIAEIKSDLKDIKNIIYRPAITKND